MKTKDTDIQTRSFLKIIEEHHRLIYKVCYMYASDPENLRDLYQEVTANIWQGLGSFKGNSKISTWVYRVALNTCITFFRHTQRRPSSVPLDTLTTDLATIDPENDRATQLKTMYQLIASLESLDKALIMLWLDEYSYDEISSLTGLSRNNVASRLLRARRKLVKLSDQ